MTQTEPEGKDRLSTRVEIKEICAMKACRIQISSSSDYIEIALEVNDSLETVSIEQFANFRSGTLEDCLMRFNLVAKEPFSITRFLYLFLENLYISQQQQYLHRTYFDNP